MNRYRNYIFITILCLSVFLVFLKRPDNQASGLLRIHFLDVGQGDAILIESPSGNQVLIDGGPDNLVLEKLGQVMPFYDHDLDVVLLTHGDADHITGLIGVLERYQVENIVQTFAFGKTGQYKAWSSAVDQEGSKITEAVAGTEIDIGGGAVIKILFPFTSLKDQDIKKLNDTSVVVLLDYQDFEILLTGDIEEKGERQLVLAGMPIDADVLKVGHHGSKTSTSQIFLDEVSPQAALISLGADNRYGHPHDDVLNRLEQSSISYYRTDVSGNVTLVSDGVHFSIETAKNTTK